jgi:hypothetical protein
MQKHLQSATVINGHRYPVAAVLNRPQGPEGDE